MTFFNPFHSGYGVSGLFKGLRPKKVPGRIRQGIRVISRQKVYTRFWDRIPVILPRNQHWRVGRFSRHYKPRGGEKSLGRVLHEAPSCFSIRGGATKKYPTHPGGRCAPPRRPPRVCGGHHTHL